MRKHAPAQFPRLNSFTGSGIIDLAHDGQVADAAVLDTAFAFSEDLHLGSGAVDQIVEQIMGVSDRNLLVTFAVDDEERHGDPVEDAALRDAGRDGEELVQVAAAPHPLDVVP